MTDRVTEILEDGTVYCFDIDKCIDEADKVLEILHNREGELDFDYTVTVFSLFIQSIHILTSSGWSTNDLISEVLMHSEANDIEFDNDI